MDAMLSGTSSPPITYQLIRTNEVYSMAPGSKPQVPRHRLNIPPRRNRGKREGDYVITSGLWALAICLGGVGVIGGLGIQFVVGHPIS